MSEWQHMADYTITALQNASMDDYTRHILLAQSYLSRQLLRQAEEAAEGTTDDSLPEKAIAALLSVRKRGLSDPEWCRLMVLGCRLSGQRDAEALGYAARWVELEPQNAEAQRMAESCRAFLGNSGAETADEDMALSPPQRTPDLCDTRAVSVREEPPASAAESAGPSVKITQQELHAQLSGDGKSTPIQPEQRHETGSGHPTTDTSAPPPAMPTTLTSVPAAPSPAEPSPAASGAPAAPRALQQETVATGKNPDNEASLIRQAVIYGKEEQACVEGHTERFFGPAELVHHEMISPWVHVDVHLIAPSVEHPWFTLVTQGMGARAFRDEEGEEQRCELLITLPPDWVVRAEDWQRPDRSWPMQLLRLLARFPFVSGEPIDWGHSFDLSEDLGEDSGTNFCAAMLLSPGLFEEEASACTLPDASRVTYWQVIPLYREELRYKFNYGTDALLELFTDEMLSTADPRRLNAVADHALIKAESAHEAALQHCRTLTDFVQYCVENGLVRSGFTERHPDVEWAMRTALAEEHRDDGINIIPPLPMRDWTGPLNCWASPSVLRGEGRIAVVSRDAVSAINSGWDSGLNFIGEPELAAEGDGNRLPLMLTNLHLISALLPQLPRILGLEPGHSLVRTADGRFIPADEV